MPPKRTHVPKAPRVVREAAASALWASKAAAVWKAALDAAPGRACATGVAGDPAFYSLQPGMAAKAGAGAHPIAGLTPADLVTVVSWKLARGTWRPRLLSFAQAAGATAVGEVAATAAAALGTASKAEGGNAPGVAAVSTAVTALSELKGVGPATATALLTAADPSIPFLSDEAGEVVLGKREYTAPAAAKLTVALRKRAAELGEEWTAQDVERALWSASRAPEVNDGGGVRGEGGEGPPATKKRRAR
jgi:hypothetical protein